MTSLGLLAQVVWTFLAVGTVTVGGGYAMVPVLYHEVVEVHRWVSPAEFLDAVAISQLTPGPVAIVATMIGFRMLGLPGAVMGTVAMFAPSITIGILASRAHRSLRASPAVQRALAGLKPTVLGLLLAAALGLAREALTDAGTIAIAAGALVATLRRFEPVLVIVAAGLAGLLIR